MKRTIAIVALVVFVTAASVVALPWLLTPPLFGLHIAEAVERATGRTLTFTGRPQLTLWPEVTLGLKQVELSNPPGMFEGRSVAIDSLRFEVSLASLLLRDPAIEEIVAVRPRINLVVDSEGRSNFAPSADGDAGDNGSPEAGEAHDGARLPPIDIVDGEIKYLNERAGRVLTLSNVELSVSRSGSEGAISLRGGFHWARQPIAVAVYIKSPARLTQDGSPSDMTLTSPLFNAAFNGRTALKEGIELAGTLDFTTDALSDLVTSAGLAESVAPQLKSLSLAGAVDVSRHTMQVKDAELELGPTSGTGDVAVDFKGVRPRITGDLGLDRVELTGTSKGSEETSEAVADWSALPINLSALRAFDARLSLSVSEIAYGTLTTGPARLDVKLDAGRLDATLEEMGLYGGTATGRFTIDDSSEVPRFDATLQSRSVETGRLVTELTGLDGLGGTADFDVDLEAIGLSPRELVGRLDGSGRLSIRNGAVGVDVPVLLTRLDSGVLEDWTPARDGRSRFSVLVASFAVADGIAETDDIALDGPAVRVSGAGSIDVLRQRLDLKLTPQVRAKAIDGDDAEAFTSFPVPVVIEGFWSAPRIYPDVDGILDEPDEALKALRRKMHQQGWDLDVGADSVDNALKKASRLDSAEKPDARPESPEATQ